MAKLEFKHGHFNSSFQSHDSTKNIIWILLLRNCNRGNTKKKIESGGLSETSRENFIQYLTEHLVFRWVGVQNKRETNMNFGIPPLKNGQCLQIFYML